MGKRWKPKDGEKYYIFDEDFNIWYYNWENLGIDKNCYRLGICFKTKKEATEMVKKIKQLLKGTK